MQIFELHELSIHQQEKLKPVIEKQKQQEKNYTNNWNWFIILFWGFCIAWLPMGLINVIKEFIESNFDIELIIPILLMLLLITVFYGFWFMFIFNTKHNNREKDKDDFFIVHGCIDDKKKKYYTSGDSTDTLYFYIIDGEEVQVSKVFFKGFKYRKIPVGEYRYLLLRVQDGLIRKDITEYF